MTAHELANELLKCPDLPVWVNDDTGGVDVVQYVEVVGVQELGQPEEKKWIHIR